VVVDKPAGLTSHDVVARIRRLAGTRRVGHAGTLDPMATGVLVVGVDRGTRLLGHLAATRKVYAATARLGVTTTTDDAQGEVTARSPTGQISERQVRAAASAFTGDIEQVPSTVSAIKVDGERAHARARRGEQVRLVPRPVTVHTLTVTAVRVGPEHIDLDVVVECSSGTYIRALARDLGARLGVGGHLTALRRTAVGPFGVDVAHALNDLDQHGVEMLTLAEAAGAVFPVVQCEAGVAEAVSHGRVLDPAPAAPDGTVALVDSGGRLLALYDRARGTARALVVFEPA